jgi:hypothetical protein
MIEQVGNAFYLYGAFTASGLGATGLTVTVDVYRNRSEVVTAASATEMGDGVYYYEVSGATNNAVGDYIGIFKTAGTADQKHVFSINTVKTWAGYINAAIDSRLPTSSYTAPPTAVQNRQEMDTNSTKLANLDATTSSRLASASYTAPPAASAIRSEIDTNSTKLDVAVGTRLASASYTAPDNSTISATKTVVDAIKAVTDTLSGLTAASITTAVWAAAARTLTAATNITAAIADAVWDEALSGHVTAGSAGDALSDAGGAADPLSNVVPGSYANGTAGYAIGTAYTAAAINIVNPLDTENNLSIVEGSDYTGGNAILFTGAGSDMDLSSGALEFRAIDRTTSGATASVLGTVDLSGSTPRLSLTSAETTALRGGSNRYGYQLWHEDGSVSTCLVRGTITVLREIVA